MTQPLRAPDPRLGVQPLAGRPRPAAGRRLAAAGRPRLRRPHAVGAAAERRLVVRRAGAAADRPDQPARGPGGRRGGRRRPPSRSPSPHREGRPVTEGEPDWSGRRAAAARGHPGAARRRRGRRAGQGHQPGRHPVAVDAGAHLPRHRRRPLPDGLGRAPSRREKPQDAEMSPRVGDGLVRLDGAGRATYASPNALSAYRRMGVVRRPRRRRPRRGHPQRRGRPGGRRGGRRRASRAAVGGPVPRRHGRRGRLGDDAGAGAAAARARGRGRARWCWSATSPTSAAGTGRC